MKDYVKRTSAPSAIYTRRKPTPSFWTADRFLLVFIAMMVIFAMIFGARSFYLKHKATVIAAPAVVDNAAPVQKAAPAHVAADTSEKPHSKPSKVSEKAKSAADKSVVTTASNEPKYDFYQILPKMTVDVEKEDSSGSNPPSQ